MEKEDIALAGQLLNSMLESVNKLEEAKAQNNTEEFDKAKKVVLSFQKELDKII